MRMRPLALAVAAGVAALTGLGLAGVATAVPTVVYPYMSPNNTAITLALVDKTTLTATGMVDGVPITMTCTGVNATAMTPDDGITAPIANAPVINPCTDNFGGTDTIRTKKDWTWSLVLRGNTITGYVYIPPDGVSITSTKLPAKCTVNLAPKGWNKWSGPYSQTAGIQDLKGEIPAEDKECPKGTTISRSFGVSVRLGATPIVTLVTGP